MLNTKKMYMQIFVVIFVFLKYDQHWLPHLFQINVLLHVLVGEYFCHLSENTIFTQFTLRGTVFPKCLDLTPSCG